MSGVIHTDYRESPHVSAVVREIVRLLAPQKIYLYNQRVNAQGATTGFKLCIVADCPNTEQAECKIYVDVDSEVPFDVLLYTPVQWEQLIRQDKSFASHIARNGVVVYG